MQSYIVNSVRSAKAKTKAALLQAMSQLDMEVYHHENRNLHRVKEIQPMYLYQSLLFDPLKSSVGLFMIEVLSKSIREEEQNEDMFAFITEKLQWLDLQQKVPVNFLLNFLLDLSTLLGFSPQGVFSEVNSYFDLQEGNFVAEVSRHPLLLNPSTSEMLSKLIQQGEKEISAGDRRKLLDSLLQYYQLHVPNFSLPKSLKVLDEVFRS